MRKFIIAIVLVMSLMFVGVPSVSVEIQESIDQETIHLDLYPINHSINVGTIKEAEWEHEDVTKIEMVSAPGEAGSDYENRTLEGGIFYIAHDNTFLYVLADSIYCQQQIRLE